MIYWETTVCIVHDQGILCAILTLSYISFHQHCISWSCCPCVCLTLTSYVYVYLSPPVHFSVYLAPHLLLPLLGFFHVCSKILWCSPKRRKNFFAHFYNFRLFLNFAISLNSSWCTGWKDPSPGWLWSGIGWTDPSLSRDTVVWDWVDWPLSRVTVV